MAETPTGDGAGPARELPVELVSELLRVVPRLVDRTRGQAELALSLGRHLPCLGGLLASGATPAPDRARPGMHESVGIDVLSLLDDPDAAAPAGTLDSGIAPTPPPAPEEAPETQGPVPTESELPIQDYDSLAASQVVPRLATLAPAELHAVRAYELAHRHRQTILNRVAQRLAD